MTTPRKIRLLFLPLLLLLAACTIPTPTSPTATRTLISPAVENIATFTPYLTTATPQPLCTPPPCAENEAYFCPDECPGGCGTTCATHTPAAGTWWQPEPGSTWHIQYQGEIDLTLPVDIYNLDLFETSAADIAQLHQRDVKVICYFSAGSWEDWRPDAGDFPAGVIGAPLEGWPGENWLDIRQLDVLMPIMTARLELAAQKGCDGVDPDNVNGYANDTGFELMSSQQLIYNRRLAEEAHALGLAIGLKNDLDQIVDLVSGFDFAVNEECFSYDECIMLFPFTEAGKAIFGIEYELATDEFCPEANQYGFSFMRKNWELDAWAQNCWDN